ncbi:hypothetical protein V5799_022940 [Amblyomma americanum]|uniref:Endonuclease/exonuclease/phosphatase domain-containing protein n=1 Tax=Amblyomma americanum TaxID=6943 RepID=A0AAQ4FIZ4_AMBAM
MKNIALVLAAILLSAAMIADAQGFREGFPRLGGRRNCGDVICPPGQRCIYTGIVCVRAPCPSTPICTPRMVHQEGSVYGTMEHALIERIPTKQRKQSIFILNVYSSPSKRRQRFRALFQRTLKIAGSRTLIAGGDFNAADTAWGYGYSTNKGRLLGEDAQEVDCTLLTDPAHPTRIGTSTTSDTTSDLTFV